MTTLAVNKRPHRTGMSTFIKNLTGFFSKPKELSYEEQRAQAHGQDRKKRLSLAADTQTNKEILYYLAESDPDPKVRKAVIENEAMPVQVTPKLAQDADQDVRLALARRLIGLLPDLQEEEHSHLYAFAVQSLGTLALDEVLKVRVALSSALKDYAFAPPKVAGQLAKDVEQEVSEPILRFCAALSDEDLILILRGHPATWAIEAIASRKTVSENVSEAVIETENVPGGKALISNDGAQISESLLHTIVERARSCPEWHGAIAGRAHLPADIAMEMVEFVDASVREILMNREDFDEQVTEEVAAAFKRRMEFANEDDGSESVQQRLRKLMKEGRLDNETISDAIGMRDYALVNAAIAHMAGTTLSTVKTVMETQKPKSIVAVCWKAGLSMRLALLVQQEVAHVNHKELIYPSGGTDYPLTIEEMEEMLEFLGVGP